MIESKKYPVEHWKVEKCFQNSKLGDDCCLKGCKWSPDGKCLLTASEDSCLRLFEPHLLNSNVDHDKSKNPVIVFKEGGTIYDFAWYPAMNSSDPITCVFASTSQNSPVHLWDAWNGELRATYQPINHLDEVSSAYSVCFSSTGKLYCGLKKEIRVFQLDLPGRESEKRPFKTSDLPAFQNGIASAIAVNPAVPDLYAVGSYDKSIGLYCEPNGNLLCLLQAHLGGVTHLMFAPDGNRLYSGGRKDSEILCWDLRKPGSLLFTIQRTVKTHQRIYFDQTIDGRFLITGNTDGFVDIFDVNASVGEDKYLQSAHRFQAHDDCANGVSIDPQGCLLATSSGQRHASTPQFSDDEESTDDDEFIVDNSVKLWTLPDWMTNREASVESMESTAE